MNWPTLGRPADEADDHPDPLEDQTLPPDVRLARTMEHWRVDRDAAALLIAQHDNDGDRLID